jgi:predicted MFS family arabinose efflux permease
MVPLGYGTAVFAGNLFGGWAAGRNFFFALPGTAFLIALSVAGLLLAGSNTLAAFAWGCHLGFRFRHAADRHAHRPVVRRRKSWKV